MSNFEWLRTASLDELIAAANTTSDIVDNWFSKKFCDVCDPITTSEGYLSGEHTYAYCELNHHCKHLPELGHIPSDQDLLRFWLNEEREE